MVKIGNVEISGPMTLAPMAGVTDFAFRAICTELGAALTTTEMVSAKALCYGDNKTKSLLYNLPGCRPFAAQIFGHEPEIMAQAAPMAIEYSGADMLDINMGCPVGKIVKSGDGSALMRDPELAGKIVQAVVESVDVPVTVKFRKGFDGGSVNAVEFAKTMEQAGAAAIAVHGRTRAQMYSGRADWDIIREVKNPSTFRSSQTAIYFPPRMRRISCATPAAILRWQGAACSAIRGFLPRQTHCSPAKRYRKSRRLPSVWTLPCGTRECTRKNSASVLPASRRGTRYRGTSRALHTPDIISSFL